MGREVRIIDAAIVRGMAASVAGSSSSEDGIGVLGVGEVDMFWFYKSKSKYHSRSIWLSVMELGW